VKVNDFDVPETVVEPTPETEIVTISAVAFVTLIHAFPEPSKLPRGIMYVEAELAEINASPETVTFTPPAESMFAAFPAASLSEIFTNEPLVEDAPEVLLNGEIVAVIAAEPSATTTVWTSEYSEPLMVPESSTSLKNTHL